MYRVNAFFLVTLFVCASVFPVWAGEITERNLLFLEYPDFPNAHSSWGSIGYSAHHNKVVIGVTDHIDRLALYEYDVSRKRLTLVGFIAELANLRHYQWQGKIHSYIVEGPDGGMYFATDGGDRRQGQLMNYVHGYQGGFFFKWDPAKRRLSNLGMGLKYQSLKNIAVDAQSGKLYGVTGPEAHLLLYDYKINDLRDLGRLSGAYVPRTLFTDWWGNVYYTDWRQRLVKYEPSTGRLLFAREPLPSFPGVNGVTVQTGMTAFAQDRPSGVIYIVTYGAKLLAFRPTREGIGPVEDLGGIYEGSKRPWEYWCRSLALGTNQKLYYFVGGHGKYTDEHGNQVLMMEYDITTRSKRLLMTFPLETLREVPGIGVTDREGNIYFA